MKTPMIAFAAALSIAGCATSTTDMTGREIRSPTAETCHVTVYRNYEQASAGGPVQPLCVIEATSQMTWSHTVSAVVQQYKAKACACGSNAVYVEQGSQGYGEVARVTMIAFRYGK